jgi:alpha-galactosidase
MKFPGVIVDLDSPSEDWCETETGRYYLAVWRRGGSTRCKIPIAPLEGREGVAVEFLYPTQLTIQSSWNDVKSELVVELPETVCARLFRLQV